ncbi:MAG: hypothetical protein ACOZCL_08625 [Bacillota bacterium]
MARAVPEGHVVEEFMIGNTKIKICDDAYINKTPEDIEKILKRLTAIGWEIVRDARAAGKDV